MSRSFQQAHFCICVCRTSPWSAKGWSQVEMPNGWVQLIRGPRPKSVQWPRATKEGKPKQVIPQRQLRTPTASSRPSPEEVAEQARKRVGQFASRHACIGSIRPSTSSSRRGSQEGKRARHPSKSRGASPVHRAIPDPCEEEVGGGGEGSGGVAQKSAILSEPKWFLRRGSPG